MLRTWIEKERQAEAASASCRITYLLPSYIAVSTMLVNIEILLEKAHGASKIEKKKTSLECLIRSLGLANAWCQFRIKIGQNGLDKDREI
jgi:hypothetical protein